MQSRTVPIDSKRPRPIRLSLRMPCSTSCGLRCRTGVEKADIVRWAKATE